MIVTPAKHPIALFTIVALSSCVSDGRQDDDDGLGAVTASAGDEGDGDGDEDEELPSFDSLDPGDGDGDGDGEGGGDTGNPDDHDSNCGEVEVAFDPLPPNIMLVLDKSGSMSENKWDVGGTQVTRWSSLHGVVSTMLDTFQDSAHFGVKYYPKNDAANDIFSGCMVDPGVHVEIGPDTGAAILAAIPAADAMVKGATPTNTGLLDAVKYMKTIDDANAEGIILVLDGDTNCLQSNAQVAATAADAWANDIPVYVVGVDLQPDIVTGLEAVAVAGGTERVFNTTDADALSEALKALILDIGSCKIPLDPVPMFADFVDVVVDNKSVTFLENVFSCDEAIAAGTPDGWVYTDDAAPWDEIEICGSQCDKFLASMKVDITFQCPPPG